LRNTNDTRQQAVARDGLQPRENGDDRAAREKKNPHNG
jgi:hypothetical protein